MLPLAHRYSRSTPHIPHLLTHVHCSQASLSDPTISRRIEWGISHVGATSTTNPPPAAPDRAAKKAIAKLKIAEMIDEMKKGLTEDFDEKFMVNTEKIMVAVTQQMDQKVDKDTWEQSNAKRASKLPLVIIVVT